MGTLRSRLQWHEATGALHDGPRRYLMMRPDVLMGALVALDDGTRAAMLDAWAASTCRHGGASLQAYAQQLGGDTQALIDATVDAAADLGWGRWTVQAGPGGLQLQVAHSPFVDGWRAAGGGLATQPVCAPVRGLFTALLSALGTDGATVEESRCAAMQHAADAVCRFVVPEDTR